MTITVLGSGTSGGVPMIGCDCAVCRSDDEKDKRLRSSIMIEANGSRFIVDAGPDFRQQMLREKVHAIDAILLTHQHRDHTAGLDDIRAFNYWQKKPVDIYLTTDVEKAIRNEFDYAFGEKNYPGLPEMNLINFGNRPFYISEVKFNPILVYHLKLPVFGFRVNDFTYITDANYIPEEEKEKIKGSKVLIINALRQEKHISHFSLGEAIDLIHELKPEKAYLTHISHQLGKHAETEHLLPPGIFLAYDGLKIEL